MSKSLSTWDDTGQQIYYTHHLRESPQNKLCYIGIHITHSYICWYLAALCYFGDSIVHVEYWSGIEGLIRFSVHHIRSTPVLLVESSNVIMTLHCQRGCLSSECVSECVSDEWVSEWSDEWAERVGEWVTEWVGPDWTCFSLVPLFSDSMWSLDRCCSI